MEALSLSRWASEFQAEAWADRFPLDGTLELTRRCPFACPHCYCAPPGPRELSTAEALGLLREIADAGCLTLTLTGGEPLARTDFPVLYRTAVDLGLLVTVFTNGCLLGDDHLALFGTHPPLGLEVSVYGASEATYRRATGVVGAWNLVARAVEAAAAAGLPLRLKTVATRTTAPDLAALTLWAKSLDAPFRFDPGLNPRLDGDLGPLAERLSPDAVVALEGAFPDRAQAWADALAAPAPIPGPLEPGLGCGAGRTSFYITAEGVLTPCVIVPPAYGVPLKGGDFADAWQQELPRCTARIPPEAAECATCPLAGACDHCPAWAYLEVGRWDGASPHLCHVARLRAQAFGAPS